MGRHAFLSNFNKETVPKLIYFLRIYVCLEVQICWNYHFTFFSLLALHSLWFIQFYIKLLRVIGAGERPINTRGLSQASTQLRPPSRRGKSLNEVSLSDFAHTTYFTPSRSQQSIYSSRIRICHPIAPRFVSTVLLTIQAAAELGGHISDVSKYKDQFIFGSMLASGIVFLVSQSPSF